MNKQLELNLSTAIDQRNNVKKYIKLVKVAQLIL